MLAVPWNKVDTGAASMPDGGHEETPGIIARQIECRV